MKARITVFHDKVDNKIRCRDNDCEKFHCFPDMQLEMHHESRREIICILGFQPDKSCPESESAILSLHVGAQRPKAHMNIQISLNRKLSIFLP